MSIERSTADEPAPGASRLAERLARPIVRPGVISRDLQRQIMARISPRTALPLLERLRRRLEPLAGAGMPQLPIVPATMIRPEAAVAPAPGRGVPPAALLQRRERGSGENSVAPTAPALIPEAGFAAHAAATTPQNEMPMPDASQAVVAAPQRLPEHAAPAEAVNEVSPAPQAVVPALQRLPDPAAPVGAVSRSVVGSLTAPAPQTSPKERGVGQHQDSTALAATPAPRGEEEGRGDGRDATVHEVGITASADATAPLNVMRMPNSGRIVVAALQRLPDLAGPVGAVSEVPRAVVPALQRLSDPIAPAGAASNATRVVVPALQRLPGAALPAGTSAEPATGYRTADAAHPPASAPAALPSLQRMVQRDTPAASGMPDAAPLQRVVLPAGRQVRRRPAPDPVPGAYSADVLDQPPATALAAPEPATEIVSRPTNASAAPPATALAAPEPATETVSRNMSAVPLGSKPAPVVIVQRSPTAAPSALLSAVQRKVSANGHTLPPDAAPAPVAAVNAAPSLRWPGYATAVQRAPVVAESTTAGGATAGSAALRSPAGDAPLRPLPIASERTTPGDAGAAYVPPLAAGPSQAPERPVGMLARKVAAAVDHAAFAPLIAVERSAQPQHPAAPDAGLAPIPEMPARAAPPAAPQGAAQPAHIWRAVGVDSGSQHRIVPEQTPFALPAPGGGGNGPATPLFREVIPEPADNTPAWGAAALPALIRRAPASPAAAPATATGAAPFGGQTEQLPTRSAASAQPELNLEHVTEQVYRRLVNRLRSESERRGW